MTILRLVARSAAALAVVALLWPLASARAGNETTYSPANGRGRVVVLISGDSGLNFYRPYANELARRGYYTVLLEGADILSQDRQGGQRLLQAIERAQRDPQAVPGKVAVIGFSRGGGGALAYATRMPGHVAVVVAYYPQTNFILRRGDLAGFVGAMRVPVLAFAGAQDTYRDCCLIGTARSLAAQARQLGRAFELVEYADAGHDFNLDTSQFRRRGTGGNFNSADAADAWQRTMTALRRYLGG